MKLDRTAYIDIVFRFRPITVELPIIEEEKHSSEFCIFLLEDETIEWGWRIESPNGNSSTFVSDEVTVIKGVTHWMPAKLEAGTIPRNEKPNITDPEARSK